MNSHEEVIVAVLENKAVAMWCTSCSLAHPANFILVTSMYPCPGDFYTGSEKECAYFTSKAATI
jgi:predicted ATPase with chaperone activity